ncbi:MAG: response regulator [Acidimicrobiales bacterium]|jgi:diguanylate cyclase (GGDEF)-like protein
MTVDALDDASLGSALAALWQRHRELNLDRISVLEAATADLLRGVVDDEATAACAVAAHQLAGSLGTFGFDAGSRAALEAEFLLREPSIDGRLLAEAVVSLRYSVEDVGKASNAAETAGPGQMIPEIGSTALILSIDADLISRLTTEASAFGISIVPITDGFSPRPSGADSPTPVFVDDDRTRSWTRSEMLHLISALAEGASVKVLTDGDTLVERLELARAGATAVIPRSQSAHQIVLDLTESLANCDSPNSTVLTLNADTELLDIIHSSLNTANWRIESHDNAPRFWRALEERGADMVIIDAECGEASSLDLCRVIRAHTGWKQLPLILVGDQGPDRRHRALVAGANDYLDTRLSRHDAGVRLRMQLEHGRAVRARHHIDPLTGAENRQEAERSMDRLLRRSQRNATPLAFVLIMIDEIDEIRGAEGNAMADVVLRRLGARLVDHFRDEDLVGRWTPDGFVLGVYGATREAASERVTEVSRTFAAESFSTTSGTRARYTFSAGIASSPADGSSLSSLERVSETALRRARATQNTVVLAGERPPDHLRNNVDVVVVEDDDSVADVIEHALSLRQYDFLRFSDGAEAARALGDGEVTAQVVLLDVGLPSLDGFGVLQVLSDQGVLRDTKVIMLTARSNEAEMLRALGLGATEHIAKPFSIPVLLGRLDQTRARVQA